MREHDIDKHLISNIEIPDAMRESLIQDVKSGKRTKDIRFRYSTTLMALCVIGVLVISGSSASAAYISYKNRVENMPQEEQQEYVEELENDTDSAVDESMTRSLTRSEKERLAVLQNSYYKDGVFPEENMAFLETLSELKPDMLAYVEEDNKIHFPEGEMTDEQLLQYIDHEAKYMHTIEENDEQTNAEDESADQETKALDEQDNVITYDVSAEDEETLKQKSKELINKIYGEEVDDSWNFDVYGMDWPESDEFDEASNLYEINWYESDAPNAKTFQITIPKNSDGTFIINRYGMEVFADCDDFTWEEAQEYLPQGEETVKTFVKEKFGLGEPDRIEYGGAENVDGESVECSWIPFKLYYGDDYVVVHWLISTNEVNSIMSKSLIKVD